MLSQSLQHSLMMNEIPERVVLSSELYPLVSIESVAFNGGSIVAGLLYKMYFIEGIDTRSYGITSGSLVSVVTYYTYTDDPEGIDSSSAGITGGSLDVVVRYGSYDNYTPEGIDFSSSGITGGSLDVVVRYGSYDNYAPEGIDFSSSGITGGTLA